MVSKVSLAQAIQDGIYRRLEKYVGELNWSGIRKEITEEIKSYLDSISAQYSEVVCEPFDEKEPTKLVMKVKAFDTVYNYTFERKALDLKELDL